MSQSATRRAWWTRGFGFAAVAIVAGLTGCSGGETPKGPDPADSSESPSATPDDTAIEVVDSGVSDVAGEAVSYGALVENTSDTVAFMSVASVSVLDSDGEIIESGEENELYQQGLTAIFPGKPVGFGATVPSKRAAEADSITVEIGVDEWWSLEDAQAEFPEVTTSHVSVAEDDGETLVSYAVSVTEGLPVSYASAVFRDSDGAIVGGEAATQPQALAPGDSQQQLVCRHGLPEAADSSETEVYIVSQV
ncbi:MAG TPA: hypothetical protein H9902_15295 [Candidatus Stackebrandtia faecavium]|nr:hypothetical protein [Candidatus Stackebrandtia faecavium]